MNTRVSNFTRRSVRPARPVAAVSGAGTTGAGDFDYTITGGPPNGTAISFYGPAGLFNPNEAVYLLLVPLFMGLDPPTARRVPGVLSLDANGDVQGLF